MDRMQQMEIESEQQAEAALFGLTEVYFEDQSFDPNDEVELDEEDE